MSAAPESESTTDTLQRLLLVGDCGSRVHALPGLADRVHCIEAPLDTAVIADILLSQRVALIVLQATQEFLQAEQTPAAGVMQRLSASGLPGLLLVPETDMAPWFERVPVSWEVLPIGLSDAALSHRIAWYLDNLAAMDLPRNRLVSEGSRMEDLQDHIVEALSIGHVSTFEYDLASLKLLRGERRHQHFHHTPSDLADVFSMVHPDDRVRTRAVIEQAARDGGFAQADYRLLTPEGEYRWVRTMGRVLGRSATHPGRMVGVSFDVDEEHRTRIALEHARERLHVAFQGARLNSWHLDLKSGELHPGPLDEAFYGRIIRRTEDLWEIVHPEDLAELQAWHVAAEADRSSGNAVEFRARDRDGSWRWFSTYCEVIRDAAGAPEWMYGVTWDINGRKVQEQAAELSRQRLEDALSEGSFLSWEWDMLQRRRLFSAGDERVMDGFRPESMDQLLSRIHPDDHQALQDALREVMRGGAYRVEFRFWSEAQHAYRWIESRGNGVTDANSEVRYLRGVSFDITDQVMLAHEAMEAEQRMVEALQAADMLCWEWDLDSGRRRTWGADEAVLGSRPATVEQAMELVHPDDLDAHRSALEVGRATGKYHHEFRIRDLQGNYRWILSRGRPLYNAQGELVAMRGVSQDITIKRQEDQRVIRAEQRMSDTLSAVGMVGWEIEFSTGNLITWGASESLLGLRKADLTDALDRVHPEDDAANREALRLAQLGADYHSEFRYRGENDEERWILSIGRPIRDAKGRVVALRGVAQDVTEQHEKEQRIMESEQRLHQALEAGRMISWEWNLVSGERRSWGDSDAQAGADPDRIAVAESMVLAEDRPRDEALVRYAIETRGEYENEFRVQGMDGKVRWLYSRGAVRCDSDGRPHFLQGVALDVTEKHAAEEALRRSEARFARVLSASRMVSWEWSLQKGLISLSGDVEGVFGCHPSSAEELDALIHPDDFDDDMQRFLRAAQTDTEYNSELRILRPDGQERWLMSRGSRVDDPGQEDQRYFGVTWDITERKQQEDALRRNLEWLQLAVIGAGVNTWTLNLADQTRRGGLMDEAWYGQAPTSIQQLHQLLEPGEQQKIEDALLVAVDNDSLIREQIRLRKADGTPMTLEVIGRPRYDPSGVAIEVSGVSIDVTDREIDRAQLVAALRRAEEAVAAKAKFLASMSHEIRTPLNGVIGVTQLLRGTPLTSRQAELADTLYHSADQLLGVINDILDFSKLEDGQMRMAAEPFDLAGCLADAMGMVASQAAMKRLCLVNVWEFPPGLILRGDAQRLRQLLLNLLSNAVKFTDVGSVQLEAGYDSAAQRLRLVVRDTGIGISDSVRQHLFQPFWQGDATMTRRFGGTGLGLVICRELAIAMGGWIDLLPSSEGTAFEAELAVEMVEDAPMPDLGDAEVALCDLPEPMVAGLTQQLRYLGVTVRQVGSFSDLCPESVGEKEIILTRQPVAAAHPFVWHELLASRRLLLTLPYTISSQMEASATREFVRYPVFPHDLSGALQRLHCAKGPEGQITTTAPPVGEVLGSGLRILMAEDNDVNQFLASAMLEEIGLDVVCVDDGFKAVNACRESAFDVLLMDIEMPLMSGIEATQILRSHDAHRPYIIALTAHVLPESKQRMLSAGMDDILHKPLILDDLRQALLRAQAKLKALG